MPCKHVGSPALEVVMYMFVKVLRSMVQVLELVRSMFTGVLQSMPSPLEMCACTAVVDGSETRNAFQSALAVTSLFLSLCGWHVPRVILYHNVICRFLSALCMQALFPYSPTLTCLAFLNPTFGKMAQSTPTSAPESGVCASEHVSTSAGDKTSLDDVIAKSKTADKEDTCGKEVPATAITLRAPAVGIERMSLEG